jgi:hypothetical protein
MARLPLTKQDDVQADAFFAWRVDWEVASMGKGLGPSRYTLHVSAEAARQSIEEHWTSMPVLIPVRYERPVRTFKVNVSQKEYAQLCRAGASGLEYPQSPEEANAAMN